MPWNTFPMGAVFRKLTAASGGTALFTDDEGRPYVAAQLAEALKRMLLHAYEPATVRLYSSTAQLVAQRSNLLTYLCTSLLEAGASRAQIQALCRWQTEESINVYAGRFTKESCGTLLTDRAVGGERSFAHFLSQVLCVKVFHSEHRNGAGALCLGRRWRHFARLHFSANKPPRPTEL